MSFEYDETGRMKNPDTGRYVLPEGQVGKKIIEKYGIIKFEYKDKKKNKK